VDKSEREARHDLILNLRQAGVPYRDIARRVGLSKSMVHKMVKRQLAEDTEREEDLEDVSTTEHVGRLQALRRAVWAKALKGDFRAVELCRRLLDSEARVKGLNTSVAERLKPYRDDDDNADFDDDFDEDLDSNVIDLKEMRWVRNRNGYDGAGIRIKEGRNGST
jgi:predicted transcriptional regulator